MTDLRRAVQWGTWLTGGVLLLVLYRHQGLAGSRAAYLTTVGVWAATAGLLVWPRRHTRLRRTLAAILGVATLAATAAVAATVPAALQHTTTNWAVGTNGWLLLTIASGGRLTLLMLCLIIPVVFAESSALRAGEDEVVLMTARALGILGLQAPIALAARAIERSARAASLLSLARESIRTDQFVAAALHDDRLRRSHAVAAAVEPVLASLAGPAPEAPSRPGPAPEAPDRPGPTPETPRPDPDETLRRRSGVAAAQVRRLLAEWHRAEGDPLGDDLSACLDDVQAAGARVEVAVHTAGLPVELRRAACEVVRAIARLPAVRLRLTAVPTATHLCLSVVARTAVPGSRLTFAEVPAPLTIRTTTVDETLWVELTCPV
ncbi:hypothetical protein [Actinoplanes sp. NBRC 103695]|uniref:hypothetical protein n=1 Tax=Actinoplanes sp. NBRC 103695 TaxID=3032202 RepID=UPI0024A3681A|nr:hypothetical protein [Actinoplanes sp. NBRC 103695]GLY93803.1 hypothetical protein Acsp02_10590 [Actinoplanes sp. NBRC 103695]